MSAEPHRRNVQYPGGISARYRWAGSGQAAAVFALSETGGRLEDHGVLVSSAPDRLCRAELRVESPTGVWTARFASPIFDEPAAVLWDVPALLLVRYGFLVYALASRTGELRWTFRSGSPVVGLIASSRLQHVIAQTEVETVALRADGSVAWRIAHNDVVVDFELVGGRLIITSYDGQRQSVDPATGQSKG